MMFRNFQVFFTRNGKIVGTKQVSIPKGGFFPTVGMLSSCEKVRVDLHPLTGWCPWSLAFFCFLFETSIHQCNDPTFVSPTHQTAKKRFTLPLYPRWMLLIYHSFKQENIIQHTAMKFRFFLLLAHLFVIFWMSAQP